MVRSNIVAGDNEMAGNKNTKYFDDFSLGEKMTTDAITIDQCDINQFAGFSGDFNHFRDR